MSNIPKMSLASMNGNMEWTILTGKTPVYQYENGKRISNTPISWRISVLLPGNCFSPISVKINTGDDPLIDITEDMIAEACATMKPIFVRFIDCSVSIYAIDGLKMSASASAVEMIKPTK